MGGFLGLYIDDANLSLVQPGQSVLVGPSRLTVRAIRRADRGHQVAFEEVPDRTAAAAIRGREVFATTTRELDPDEFWSRELIGLAVITVAGETVGTVTDVVVGSAQDRLVVDGPGGVSEVPFVDELVPRVDLDARTITIADLPGLISGLSS
jgi:16S rRNA processing protein RimM